MPFIFGGAGIAQDVADGIITNAKVATGAAIAIAKLARTPPGATDNLFLIGMVLLDISERCSTTSTSYANLDATNIEGGWGGYFTAPTGSALAYKFAIGGYNSNAANTIYAKVVDNTAAADVAGSEVSQVVAGAGGASVYNLMSGEITIDPTHDHKVQIKTSANTATFFGAKLLVYAKVS